MPSAKRKQPTTFAGVPYVENHGPRETDIGVLGIPYRTPDAAISLHMQRLRRTCQADSTGLPAAVRE
jgi:hypothetical protein